MKYAHLLKLTSFIERFVWKMKLLKIGESLITKASKNEIKKACFQLFEFLNFKNKLKNIDKIIIKPNIVSAQRYTLGSITDPIVVDELIKYTNKSIKIGLS